MNDSNKLLKEFGQRVREARSEFGLTQLELAEKIGHDRTYIGGIERGERNPSLVIICKLAKALKKDLPDLIPARLA